MKKLFLASSSILIFLACSHKVITGTSKNLSSTSEQTKPDAKAIYTSDVRPVFQNKCTPCHFPTLGGNKAPLDNQASAVSMIDDILLRVQLKPDERGYMPFHGKKEGLTGDEIASLKAWKLALVK